MPWKATPLHLASQNGHVESARSLIQGGAKISAERKGNYTPLHVAALHGRAEVVELLIQSGADIDKKSMFGIGIVSNKILTKIFFDHKHFKHKFYYVHRVLK